MKQHIENLIHYEISKGIITKRDYVYVKNQLYHLLNQSFDDVIYHPNLIIYPSDALNPILDSLEKDGVLDGSFVSRDLFDAKIMNVFASLPSVVQQMFDEKFNIAPKHATNFLYNYAKSLNYIRYDRILKNVSYHIDSKFGKLDITINLSKPEKDPKSILLESQSVTTSYPKCLLCLENEGFSGNAKKDSRDQHRLIELNLNEEIWYFQYSPYIYYNEHAIVFSKDHRPMSINEKTFRNLLALVDNFDGYFFGSNADLPIVGGSILSHDHYQGGLHHFPIEDAKVIKSWQLHSTTLEMLYWPLSTIRIKDTNEENLVKLATNILSIWKQYSNPSIGLYAKTGETPHHTITPIARKKGETFEMDLILRSNLTTPDFPSGVYHPKPDKWHIKKENIGLIEAIGLAILPARLNQAIKRLRAYYFDNVTLEIGELIHKDWFDDLSKKHTLTPFNFDDIIEKEIGLVFEKVLIDCGVFNISNQQTFNDFIEREIYEKLSK